MGNSPLGPAVFSNLKALDRHNNRSSSSGRLAVGAATFMHGCWRWLAIYILLVNVLELVQHDFQYLKRTFVSHRTRGHKPQVHNSRERGSITVTASKVDWADGINHVGRIEIEMQDVDKIRKNDSEPGTVAYSSMFANAAQIEVGMDGDAPQADYGRVASTQASNHVVHGTADTGLGVSSSRRRRGKGLPEAKAQVDMMTLNLRVDSAWAQERDGMHSWKIRSGVIARMIKNARPQVRQTPQLELTMHQLTFIIFFSN